MFIQYLKTLRENDELVPYLLSSSSNGEELKALN